MQAFPSVDAYVALLENPDYQAAFTHMLPHVQEIESLAIEQLIDFRADPWTDCAWRPWAGFNSSAPFPFEMGGPIGQLFAAVAAGESDDGLPIQVWNVDQMVLPNATRFPGGSPEYVRGPLYSGWKMGGIHRVVMSCPGNRCLAMALQGDLLANINALMLVQYPSARTMARMVNDPDFNPLLKYDPDYFVKNADIPARVLNDGLATIPSPLAINYGKQVPTNCNAPEWHRARAAETAVAGGSECDVDKMWDGVSRCVHSVRAGQCGNPAGSCAEWLLTQGRVCTASVLWESIEQMFDPPLCDNKPHGTMQYTTGLWELALRNGAVDECRRHTHL